MKLKRELILFLCMAAIMVSCREEKRPKSGPSRMIHVATVTNTDTQNRNEFAFISKPFRSSELSFRVSGPVDRFEVYSGNYYRKGDLIAEIDSRDFKIRKERAEGVYKQAKGEYERIKILYEKSNLSASVYEKSLAEYISAKTAFETATNELNDTKLIAPFNGYIGEVFIEKYQDVKATQPVVTFVEIDKLKIEVYVNQQIAVYAKNLKKVNLIFDAIPGSIYQADVVEISKSTTKNNLSYLLTSILPNSNGEFLAGMSGRVLFDKADSSSNLTIAQLSICHNPADGDYVWVVDPDTRQVSKRKIVIDRILSDGVVSVKSGLKEQEIVATSTLRFLSEGMSVEMSFDK